MDSIFVRSDFADRHEYRLVSIDDGWLRRFQERPYPVPRRPAGKRRRPHALPDENHVECDDAASVVLVMKGEDQLCLHDEASTRSVRRVEYSNTLLLARRRLSEAGKAALREPAAAAASTAGETSAAPPPSLPPTRVRQYASSVVVAALSRVFDSHTANPQLNILTVLANSYITIDELEREEEEEEREEGGGGAYSFAQLTRIFHSSPAELAQQLKDAGAVVHRGCVRLLHPLLVYEALTAVLTYAAAAEPGELSWAAATAHLCPSVYPPVVLASLQAVYGAETQSRAASPAQDSDEGDVCVGGMAGLLHPPRVLVGLAAGIVDTYDGVTQRVLSSGATARGLPLDTFLDKWLDVIPTAFFGTDGVPPRSAANVAEALLTQLRGCAVVEPRGGGSGGRQQGMLWWLPKAVLTNDFAARLRDLFELRPQKWGLPELQAYMGVLLAPDQNFAQVIVRYAREYRIPGQPVQYAPLPQ